MSVEQRMSKMILACILVIGGIFVGSASTVDAASDPADAPTDWAFDASSVELNDAIIDRYPTIDTSGDGFISKDEALAYTGELDISFAIASGTINGIEYFKHIDSLDLSNNMFTGEIPANIGNLTNLNKLRLDYNQLTGTIPSSISNLVNLNILILSDNKLGGNIPTNIGDLTKLELLDLSSNELSGSIPASITKLINIEAIQLFSNRLEGKIPADIGNLANLEILRAPSNKLSGEIPSSITDLSNLSMLNLSDNELSGEIPSNIGNLSKLGELYLGANQLTGEIPASVGDFSNLLVTFDVGKNQLSGTIPETFANLGNIKRLRLSENKLTGEVPSSIGDMNTLWELYLDGNQLTSLPQNVADLLNIGGLSYKYTQNQTYTQTLLDAAIVDEDFTFTGLNVYEQLPSYGTTLQYALDCPDGSQKIITPTIVSDKVTISASDLDQLGAYSLSVTSESTAQIFADSEYTTNFTVGESVAYISASANGEKDKITTTKITIDLSKTPAVGELLISDIALTTNTKAVVDVNKDSLVALGNGKYELVISGTWNEGTIINVSLSKLGTVFTPASHEVVLHTKLDVSASKDDKLISAPQTGDSNTLFAMMLLLAGSLIIGGYILNRKKD